MSENEKADSMNRVNKVLLEFDLTKLPLESDIDRESWCDAVFGALAEGDCLQLPDGVVCTSGAMKEKHDAALKQMAVFSDFIGWAELQVYPANNAVRWSAWAACDALSFIKLDDLSVKPVNKKIVDLLNSNEWKIQVGIGCCRIGETLFQGELSIEVHTERTPVTRRFKFCIPNVAVITGTQVIA